MRKLNRDRLFFFEQLLLLIISYSVYILTRGCHQELLTFIAIFIQVIAAGVHTVFTRDVVVTLAFTLVLIIFYASYMYAPCAALMYAVLSVEVNRDRYLKG